MTLLVPMRAEFYPAYLEAAIAAYAEDKAAAGGWPPDDAPALSRAEFARLLPQGLATPRHHLFEILEAPGGDHVGVLWVAEVAENGVRFAFVYDLEIAPARRRRGHATRALAALEPIARGLGLSHVGLHVFGHNPGALALYRKAGFAVTDLNMVKRLDADAPAPMPARDAACRCSVFIATSLDGFIAREDGSLDWLDRANALLPPGEDCGYQAFMADIDAVVMGRRTFELVQTFPDWPFGEMPVVVLSRRGIALPERIPGSVSVSDEAPAALVARLSAQGLKRLYIDGGQTIQGFLAAGLIDTLTVTVIPVLLGGGRPLFGPLAADIRLTHVATRAFAFGFVQQRYHIVHTD